MQNAEETPIEPTVPEVPPTPITETIALDNAATLRVMWPYLSEAKKQELIDAEVVSLAIVGQNNAGVDWRRYNGMIDVSSYYRAFGENIAPYRSVPRIMLTQDETQSITNFIMGTIPRVLDAVIEVHGGTMPPILPPYVEPVYVPEPVEETPTEPIVD